MRVRLPGLLPPLRDATSGEQYDYLPCQANPSWWDEDADTTQKREAAAVCVTSCPALAACWERRLRLKENAGGVWGGRILRVRKQTDRKRPARPDTVDDPELASWAESAGITIRPTSAARRGRTAG